MSKRVTMQDIADLAGVSIATVSNVLNRKGRVSDENRQLVLEIMEKYNYTPNLAARSLKSNQSRLISVIVPHLRRGEFKDNPFFWQIISAIEVGAHGERFHVILTGTPDSEDPDPILGRNLDGVIAIGVDENSTLFSTLDDQDIPCVFIDSHITKKEVCQVSSDDKLGGYLGTKYLTSLGYERVILVTGAEVNIEETSGVDYWRWLGYRQALEEAGIHYDPALIIGGGATVKGGYHAAQRIFRLLAEETAIFVLSDIAAMGTIRGLTELGLSIPKQVSVMGYDDIFYAGYMQPSLTTIRQNIHSKGQHAINLLVRRIEGEKVLEKNVILPVELVVRTSTKNPDG